MAVNSSFVSEAMDRMQLADSATSKRMFGGVGIFHNGLMFALISKNELYLKADTHSVKLFEDHGLEAFSYSKSNGKSYQMFYYQAPESFFEDEDETRLWTQRAIDAALRAPAKSKNK